MWVMVVGIVDVDVVVGVVVGVGVVGVVGVVDVVDVVVGNFVDMEWRRRKTHWWQGEFELVFEKIRRILDKENHVLR